MWVFTHVIEHRGYRWFIPRARSAVAGWKQWNKSVELPHDFHSSLKQTL